MSSKKIVMDNYSYCSWSCSLAFGNPKFALQLAYCFGGSETFGPIDSIDAPYLLKKFHNSQLQNNVTAADIVLQTQHMMNKSLLGGLGASQMLSNYEVTTTLTNSITGVAAKVMVTIFSGENLTGVVGFLPGSDAVSAEGAAVVWAAGVDGVHVGH